MDVSKLIEKAREATERRNYDYAIELYLQACQMSPDNATARRELRAVENRLAKEKGSSFWNKGKNMGMQVHVQALFTTKKYDAAIEKCEEVLKSDPGNISILLLLGRAALAAGWLQAAIATFEDIRNMNAGGNNKQFIEALRFLAQAYESDNKINDAQDAWATVSKLTQGADREAVVKIRDLSARTMTSKIETAAMSGQRGAAARSTQSDEQKKEAARLDRDKGEIKTDSDLKAAIDDTKADILQRPDDPQKHSKLGDLYKQSNNYEQAKQAYHTACEKDRNNPSYLFKLHDLEIWKMVSDIKAMEPKVKAGDPVVREQYQKDRVALLDYKLSSFLEREKQYSTDSKIKFELGRIYYELAGSKNDKNLYDQAIMRFQSTSRDPKFRIESGFFMGQGFAAKGQYELALKRFDETLLGMELKNEQWKNLMYAKSDALQKANRREDAKKSFLEIYEIDVSFRDVGQRLDDLG